MSHDLLMIIYGAIVGVGSSFLTTLFQSWLERREYERRRKDEQKRKLQQIYVPTPEEVSKFNQPAVTAIETPTPRWRSLLSSVFKIIFWLLTFGGAIYLIYWLNNPIVYFLVTAIVLFVISYIVIIIIKGS